MRLALFVFAVGIGGSMSCSHQQFAPTPPETAKQAFVLEKHGDKRTDHYFWLKDRTHPRVVEHLKKENKYYDAVMEPFQKLKNDLFVEMKSRVNESESSAPTTKGGFNYYSRFESGKQHPLYVRQSILDGKEELLLDVNELGKGHEFVQCTFPRMNNNQNLMLYACDFVGRRFYQIKGRNLKTGKDFDFTIPNTTGNLVWSKDDRYFFYTKQHPETLRSQWVYRYDIDTKRETLIFEEKDDTFGVSLDINGARNYVFIVSSSTLATEVRLIRRDHPLEAPSVFFPRQQNHEYSVIDGDEKFYILTNWQAKNFRIMECSTRLAGKTCQQQESWKEVIPAKQDHFIQDVDAFSDYMIWTERFEGLNHLKYKTLKTGLIAEVPLAKDSFVASWGYNGDYSAQTLRYSYESLRQPESVLDFSPKTKLSKIIWQRKVPHFDETKYQTERLWITARDGKKVPVSLLFLKNLTAQQAPLLMEGYGSYGVSMDPWFSASRLSLVDRGWVYALAHVRGGSELGRDWYDEGRTHHKMNTFYDFIDATEGLLKNGYGYAGHVYARGGSAGGLLMGAMMNQRPDLYHGIVAEVPFVDVLTTMLDDSIPLTTGEYDEWGNPNKKSDYDYIKQYSPYDNVTQTPYPNLLVTTGFHDSQVQYWEPAKWVAKIRELRQDKGLTLLKIDMEVGHGGASGRYDALKDEAAVQTFLLSLETR